MSPSSTLNRIRARIRRESPPERSQDSRKTKRSSFGLHSNSQVLDLDRAKDRRYEDMNSATDEVNPCHPMGINSGSDVPFCHSATSVLFGGTIDPKTNLDFYPIGLQNSPLQLPHPPSRTQRKQEQEKKGQNGKNKLISVCWWHIKGVTNYNVNI